MQSRPEIYFELQWQINFCVIKRRVPLIFFPFYVDVQHAVLLEGSGPSGPARNPEGTLSRIETTQFSTANAGIQSFRWDLEPMNVKGRPHHQQHEEASLKHAGMGRENDWRFSNGLWSSVFKYDDINLMFGEGDLSVDRKGKTLCRPVVFSFTHSDLEAAWVCLPWTVKRITWTLRFVLLLNLGWNRMILLIFRSYLYSYLL